MRPLLPQRDYTNPIVPKARMAGLRAHKTKCKRPYTSFKHRAVTIAQVMTRLQRFCCYHPSRPSAESSQDIPLKAFIMVEDAPVLPHPYDIRRRVYFSDLFWTEEFPSENGVDFKDLAKDHLTDHFSPNGSNFRLSEFPPEGTPSMSFFLLFIPNKRLHLPTSATLRSLSVGQSRLSMASYCRDQ